jgi:hypothetical protein
MVRKALITRVSMAGTADFEWETCGVDGCIGVRLPTGRKCWAHATDTDLDLALKRLGEDGHIDARGVRIDAGLLAQILAAAPQEESHPVLQNPQFHRATFQGKGGAAFQSEVGFGGATFKGEAGFGGATFMVDAWFAREAFEGEASFVEARFEGRAVFGPAFKGVARFDGATFKDTARFDGVTFEGAARFDRTLFVGAARFDRTLFVGAAEFVEATFEDVAGFGMAAFKGEAVFDRATFVGAAGFSLAAIEGAARFDQAAFKGLARFGRAVFVDTAGFREAAFKGRTVFGGATFKDTAVFGGATFEGAAEFDETTFEGAAEFDRAVFVDTAVFGGARFVDVAGFGGARFEDRTVIDEATFGGEARFRWVTFKQEASFDRATFRHQAAFGNARLGDETSFLGAKLQDGGDFSGARFGDGAVLGPLAVVGSLVLDRVVFGNAPEVAVSGGRVSLVGLRAPDGILIQARWADIVLERPEFGRSSVLAGVSRFSSLDEDEVIKHASATGGAARTALPRVNSLRGCDVRNLVLSNVDLRACRFVGAYNLDQLRIEGRVFTSCPKGLQRGLWPLLWGWTSRRVLAEEHQWRATYERGTRRKGWYPAESQAQHSDHIPMQRGTAGRLGHLAGQGPGYLWRTLSRARRVRRTARHTQARELAAIYRALRKGREDAKDEPGAADFYYGEMEMRRHAGRKLSVERVVLTLYWLVSGYALRAWRALAALAFVLPLAAWLLVHRHGFADPQAMTFWGALRYSGRTAIGLLPKDQPILTPLGDVAQIAVRVVVPLLIGLAVLSIRGRVKR